MGDGVVFDIVVNNDVFMGPATVSTMGRNITVNIRSASPANARTIYLEGQGYLFSVDANITLRLQDIVLRGISNNNRALVLVGPGSKLILDSGSKITMNASGEQYGVGGIRVNGSILEINHGAEITENSNSWSSHGGGIRVDNNGTVNIRGGLISENYSGSGINTTSGGINIAGNSTVTMSGGIISKNRGSGAGGVFIENGSSFTNAPHRAVIPAELFTAEPAMMQI